jgi:hypothetical protein
MIVRNRIPPALWKFSLFKPGYSTVDFIVDVANNLVVLGDYQYNWISGDKVVISTTQNFPQGLDVGASSDALVSFLPAAVNPTTDVITTSSFDWITGMQVEFKNLGILPTPFELNTLYTVIRVSNTQIKLCDSLVNAYKNTPIDIIDTGDGDLFQLVIVNPVFYLIVEDSSELNTVRLATTYDNAINKIPITIGTAGNGVHTMTYYGNTPSVTDILQYIMDNYGDYSEISDKYKTYFHDMEVTRAIISEFGYQYILDILIWSRISLNQLLQLIPVIHFLKGTKIGLNLVMRLLGVSYTFQEWWEVSGGIPGTYTGTVSVPPNVDAVAFETSLTAFLHNYIYPIPALTFGVNKISLDVMGHTLNV